jgi:DNA polymerase-3 subunit delta'
LLPTIRSRCQVIELRTVARPMIESALIEHGAAPELARELASLSDGAPGWAFHALDDPRLREARLQAVDQAVTWIGSANYERLVQAVRAADDFSKSRWEPLERLGVLLSVWRDTLLLGAGLRERMTYLLFADRLSGLSAAWTLADVHRAVQSVQQCIRDLETNVRPRLAMEAMVLQWPKPSRATQTPTMTKVSTR